MALVKIGRVGWNSDRQDTVWVNPDFVAFVGMPSEDDETRAEQRGIKAEVLLSSGAGFYSPSDPEEIRLRLELAVAKQPSFIEK
jgi:hypothetical protein